MCAAQGIRTKAEHVDHIRPHRGDDRLLMDPTNLQSLCVPHHASDKQQQERKGYSSRVGGDGLPLDSRHPFNT
jgi:5-methylcytosine-specific restriction protein A